MFDRKVQAKAALGSGGILEVRASVAGASPGQPVRYRISRRSSARSDATMSVTSWHTWAMGRDTGADHGPRSIRDGRPRRVRESGDTSSEDVRANEELPDDMDDPNQRDDEYHDHTITRASARAAGLERKSHYSTKTRQHYLVAAEKMWQYLEKALPERGRQLPVAFDKIFGGTGHIDLFNGETLSNAPA